MPRINIDDDWFADPRRDGLVEKVGWVADGVAVRMWRLAQSYFRVGMLTPADLFERVPHWKEWEESGLAERVNAPSKQIEAKGNKYELKGPGVYIRGVGERFHWLRVKSESGERGGKSPKKSDDAPSKQTKAKRSKRKQTQASSSSSSSLRIKKAPSPALSLLSTQSEITKKLLDGLDPAEVELILKAEERRKKQAKLHSGRNGLLKAGA